VFIDEPITQLLLVTTSKDGEREEYVIGQREEENSFQFIKDKKKRYTSVTTIGRDKSNTIVLTDIGIYILSSLLIFPFH
jgi:pSer/pThr/pTyr-binding forkhead associated (FHA) protein